MTLELTNTVVPSLRKKETIAQDVSLGNAQEVKYKKWNKILIVDYRLSASQELGPLGP